MKTARILVLAVIALALGSGAVFAQADNAAPAPDKGPSTTMAMNMMGFIPKQMVASNDGGVIILAGNKLMKYDKDLNLVKEVEIKSVAELKIDASSVQDMINKMKDKYGKGKDKSEPAPAPAAETK
ncbi:MAG: hypothetical protein PHJ00_03785 [Candidatus Omnitrophica bacterium]|nr:hypothetical protein [Candidatus Omnitrophota bacterium]MDD5655399.1 hypothetical protein [Candidatus Omnitrophota bacterium]